MTRRGFLATAMMASGGALASCTALGRGTDEPPGGPQGRDPAFEITKTEDEWRRVLSPPRFQVLRKHDTEYPGTSPLNKEHRRGTYRCAGCDLPLFSSTTKFESGTGWPSFTAPLDSAIGTSIDRSLLSISIEVHCRRCGGHLGHVFDDGPRPTGKRYCMNGLALTFHPAEPQGV